MNQHQKNVKEFMRAAGQACPDKPMMPDLETRMLRVRLVFEEAIELAKALDIGVFMDGFDCGIKDFEFCGSPTEESFCNLIEAADATADLRYVVTGTDVALGIDGEPVDAAVHESNMSKFIDGRRRDDGKWVKGPSYKPVNLAPIIEAQMKG